MSKGPKKLNIEMDHLPCLLEGKLHAQGTSIQICSRTSVV